MTFELIFSNSVLSTDYASLSLRILVAIVFLVHGWPKIKNLKMTAGFIGSLGFKPAIFWALALSIAEFFGALAILAGFYLRIAVIPLIFSMLVASYLKIFVWKSGFASDKENPSGYELDLLLIACLVSLFFLGAGTFSIAALF